MQFDPWDPAESVWHDRPVLCLQSRVPRPIPSGDPSTGTASQTSTATGARADSDQTRTTTDPRAGSSQTGTTAGAGASTIDLSTATPTIATTGARADPDYALCATTFRKTGAPSI